MRLGCDRLSQRAGDGYSRPPGSRLYPGSWSEWIAAAAGRAATSNLLIGRLTEQFDPDCPMDR
jgi:hypothetical protein